MSIVIERRWGPGDHVLIWTEEDAAALEAYYATDYEEGDNPPKPEPSFRLHHKDVPELVFALLRGTPGPVGPMGAPGVSAA